MESCFQSKVMGCGESFGVNSQRLPGEGVCLDLAFCFTFGDGATALTSFSVGGCGL